MNTKLTLLIAAALLTVPMAFAHDPAGTPKNFCENLSDLSVHDYAPPATGRAVFLLQDGNIAGDCDGDTVPADFDLHLEFAFGGAWLLSESGDGVTNGSIVCYGAASDHSNPTSIAVNDALLGPTVTFRVAADRVNLVPPTDPAEPDCGDFTTDESTLCVGSCTPTFLTGIDGAYIVFVGNADGGSVGTVGHVCAPAASCPSNPLPECANGIDDDGDGLTDWPADPGCDSPLGSEGATSSILTPLLGECLDLVDNGDADTPPARDWIDVIGLLLGTRADDPECAGTLPPLPPTASEG